MDPLETNIPEVESFTPRTPNPNRQSAGARNGKFGAGRKSPEGLAASAQNATKHALASKALNILDCESVPLFRKFRYLQMQSLQPRDYHEFLLIGNLVKARWAIERGEHMQIAALDNRFNKMRRESDNPVIDYLYFQAFDSLAAAQGGFSLLQRYLSQHHRLAHQAQVDLLAYRKVSPIRPISGNFYDWESQITVPEEFASDPGSDPDSSELPNEGKLLTHFVATIAPEAAPASATAGMQN